MGRPKKGEVFAGRYEIQELLGLGGMGSVHLALDRENGSQVALKVLSSEAVAAEDTASMLLKRFEREIETLRRIDHPDILRYLDHGEHEGAPFLVCELVSGKTLTEAMPDYRGRAEWVIALGARLAVAFAWAHAKGIVHRDIKPGNIKFTASGEPRILDYGLARWIAPDGTSAEEMATVEQMTATNIMLGTIPYMSPEQIRGQRVDHRSDIFSLGVVLYELVSGRRPYEGATIDELIGSMSRGAPPSLAPVFAERDRPSGAALEAILGMALRPGLGERFQSMGELAEALEKARASSGALPADASIAILLPPGGGDGAARVHGRDTEMQSVLAVLAGALAGRSALVAIEGPAGIGKSVVGSEAARAAHREGFLCLLARARPEERSASRQGASPLLSERVFPSRPERQWLTRAAEVFPADEAVRSALGLFDDPTQVDAGTTTSAAPALDRGAVGEAAGAAATTRAAATEAAFVEALTSLAARMPLFLLLDDADAAPPEAIAGLGAALERIQGQRVVVTLLLRTDRLPEPARECALEALLAHAREEPAAGEGMEPAAPATAAPAADKGSRADGDTATSPWRLVRLPLAPLSLQSLTSIVGDLYPGVDVAQQALSALKERSGGHPDHIREMLQSLQDQGALVRAGSSWTLEEAAEIPHPASAASRLQARLAALSPDEIGLLEAAAIRGACFTAGDVAAFAAGPPDLDAALESVARRTRLILEDPEGGWRFEPALARDGLRRRIDRERRRALETAAGRAIAAGLDEESDPALHAAAARHFLDAGLEDEALSCASRAGSAHKKAGASREALIWIEEARKIVERRIEGMAEEDRREPRERMAELELMLGECHYALSQYDRAIEHLERARSLAAAAGRDDYQARCLNALAGVCVARGDVLQAQRRAKEAERAARRAGLDVPRALALSMQAFALSRSGEIGDAEDLWAESVELLDSVNEAEEAAEVEFRLGNHHLRLDRWDRAEPCYARAAERLASGKRPLLRASVQNARAAGLILCRRPQQALPILREAAAIFASAGARHEEARSLHNIGECHYLMGELEEGRRMLERVIAVRTEIGETALKAGDLHNLAQILFDLGDVAQALDRANEALTIKRQVEDRGYVPHCLTLLGRIELEIGRTERARAAFTEVVSDFGETRIEQIQAIGGLAMTEWLSGQTGAAEKRFRGLMRQLAEIDDPLEGLLVRHRMHRFFRERGVPAAEILALMPPMVEDVEAEPLPQSRLLLSLIRSELAQAQPGHGGHEDAAGHLGEALDVARLLGCVEWIWRIERDLGALAGSTSEDGRARVMSAVSTIKAQASRIRDEDLRRSYLAHPERAAVLREAGDLPEPPTAELAV